MKVFTSCDSKYFMDHGLTLIKSCFDHGHSIKVNVINPTDEVNSKLHFLSENYSDFTYCYEKTKKPVDRAYYASSRFLMLENLLNSCQGEEDYLIVDTDSFFLRSFPTIPEHKQIGIMLRDPVSGNPANDWERRGMMVAAGLVYVRHDAIYFAQQVRKKIESYGFKWFVDQVALYEAYQEIYSMLPDKVFHFNNRHLDWDFDKDSIIWSGKGNRKSSNQKYIEMKEKIGKI